MHGASIGTPFWTGPGGGNDSLALSNPSAYALSNGSIVLAYSRAESVQTRLSQKGGQGTPQSKGQLSWLGLGIGLGLELGLGLGLGLVSRGLGLGSC